MPRRDPGSDFLEMRNRNIWPTFISSVSLGVISIVRDTQDTGVPECGAKSVCYLFIYTLPVSNPSSSYSN